MIDVVCGVIENERGEFLACLRAAGRPLAGKWEFPGGKVESGESPELALRRELSEELAIQVEVGAVLGIVVGSGIRLIPFRCRIVAGAPTLLEHEQLTWVTKENFEQWPWAEADLPILAEIFPASGDTGN